MLLPLLASALVMSAAEPTGTAMVVSRRTNVTSAEARTLSASAATLLAQLGVPLTVAPDAATIRLAKLGLRDSATCGGRKACIAELGHQLKVAWIIALSVSKVDDDRSVALELIRVSDKTVVEKDAVILPPKAALEAELLSGFAARCRAVLVPGAAVTTPPPEDSPTVSQPVTPPPEATPVVTAPVVTPTPAATPTVSQATRRVGLRRYAWIPGVATGLAAAGAGVTYGLAASLHQQLATATWTSGTEAAAAARRGETFQWVAAVSAAVAVAAGAVLVWFLVDAGDPEVALAPSTPGRLLGGLW